MATSSSYRFLKRGLDLAGAAAAGGLTLPIWAGAALAVATTMGRPVLFRQERPGLNGKIFRLYKFRSMRDAKPGEGPESDHLRLTRLGKFLRSTSIDELPALLNVLKGELSLVGPRPLLVRYLERYSPEQARRHEVKPGITGWAQVNGRNAISWERKFELDVYYVDHQSLTLDLLILAKTVAKVLQRSNIEHAGHATMPEFMGSQVGD